VFFTLYFKRLLLLIIAFLLIIAIGIIFSRGVIAETLPEEGELVLIIDPGHGGEDGGAQTAGGVLESEINLDIALKLEALAGLFGQQTVMTRETEDIKYPDDACSIAGKKVADQKSRVELINSYPGAILISIHQNCFPDRRPFGSQVLFAETVGSEEFGKLTHDLLCKSLCPDNRRVAALISDSIYLLRKVNCTAILVECGFLSNADEAELLVTENYQTKISAVLLVSYLQYAVQT
jgi:N-acetylmuramoyl-L-alanine amidase